MALVSLGRIPCSAVRPPLVTPSSDEVTKISEAMAQAGIVAEGAVREAA